MFHVKLIACVKDRLLGTERAILTRALRTLILGNNNLLPPVIIGLIIVFIDEIQGDL